jgi:redox-regulated HSP33 family molecular chaperone
MIFYDSTQTDTSISIQILLLESQKTAGGILKLAFLALHKQDAETVVRGCIKFKNIL